MLPTAPLIPPSSPSRDTGSPSSQPEPPFRIRIEHRDVRPNGNFLPEARVSFAAPLRLSGLLYALSPEATQDLLLLLTFVTPNGHCAPTVRQVAEAMRVSDGKARGRMERLLAFRWQGEPLLVHQKAESGLEVFGPRPWLASAQEDAAPEPLRSPPTPPKVATREEVIAHTRATYARPRAAVEREIEAQLGYLRDKQGRLQRMPPQEAGQRASAIQPELETALTEEQAKQRREQEEVKAMLLRAGLQGEQAEALLARYDMVRIRRQLMWLPYRRAKNSAGLLLAAIKDDYEAPPGLWRSTPTASSEPPSTQLAPGSPGSSGIDKEAS